MPRAGTGLDALVEAKLDESHGGRFIDMRSDLVRRDTGEVFWTSGGVWDRRDKRWAGPSKRSKVLRLIESQVEAARWFAAWFRAREQGRHMLTADGEPVFIVLLIGGRRGGKSNLANKIAASYANHVPGSIVWEVVPTDKDGDELRDDLKAQIPTEWARYLVDADTWYWAHGSTITIRSSYGDEEKLKKGRADVVVISEAQKHPPDVLTMTAPAIIDRGGLLILTANPPRSATGEWVTELYEKIRTAKLGAVAFELDPKLNPEIDRTALEAMRAILSAEDYAREIEGKFVSRKDVVMYAFSVAEHVHPEGFVPRGRGEYVQVEDVTRRVTRRYLGAEFDRVHGMDFQSYPHQVAVTGKFYADPDDPHGFLLWYTDVTLVEAGNEDDLIEALEAKDYSGADAVIPDASGEYQNSARTKGRGSWDMLRAKGWRKIFYPDEKAKRNPPVAERVSVVNGALKTADGRIRAYVDPRCGELISTFKKWPIRNGFPSRKAVHAHAGDAATYLPYRFFPRRAPPPKLERIQVKRPERRSWEEYR